MGMVNFYPKVKLLAKAMVVDNYDNEHIFTKKITTSVLIKMSYYWIPDNWIPALSTLTGALFVLCLYAVAWCLFKDSPVCSRLFPHCHKHHQSQPSLTTKGPGVVPSDRNTVTI
ncbi:uncharacterized protein LOC144578272 [Callithrix jacchus]